MDYPAMVYRCPGAHFGPSGTTYESRGVKDGNELRQAVLNGWADSLEKAVSVYLNEEQLNKLENETYLVKYEELNENDDNSTPVRWELEKKANELGIKFDGRTTDRKLLEKIDEVLRGE